MENKESGESVRPNFISKRHHLQTTPQITISNFTAASQTRIREKNRKGQQQQ